MCYPISHAFLKCFYRIKIIETYQLCHLQLTLLGNQLKTLCMWPKTHDQSWRTHCDPILFFFFFNVEN